MLTEVSTWAAACAGTGLRLGGVDGGRAAADQDDHGGDERAGFLGGEHHPAEGDDTGDGERVHRDDLDDVRPDVRVLERVGGIDVEEAAAVGAELLDRLLAGHREEGDGLLAALDRRRADMGHERLGLAQADIGHGDHQGEGQQEVEIDARQVGIEVAKPLAAIGGEGAGDRGGHGHAGGGRDEVVRGQARHLREGRDRLLRHIGLPVGVGDEADGGVEGQVRRHAGEALRIERQEVLEAQGQVEDDKARGREGQEARGVAQPVLRAVALDAADGIDDALHGFQHRIEPGALTLPDAGEIETERPAQADDQAQGDDDFGPAGEVHQNFSGLRRAASI
jgi:hypothetical protein